MAKDIGKDCRQDDGDLTTHPSIQNIHKKIQFHLRPVSEKEVQNIISKLIVKKSTGVDAISANNILKACAPSFNHTVIRLA